MEYHVPHTASRVSWLTTIARWLFGIGLVLFVIELPTITNTLHAYSSLSRALQHAPSIKALLGLYSGFVYERRTNDERDHRLLVHISYGCAFVCLFLYGYILLTHAQWIAV